MALGSLIHKQEVSGRLQRPFKFASLLVHISITGGTESNDEISNNLGKIAMTLHC